MKSPRVHETIMVNTHDLVSLAYVSELVSHSPLSLAVPGSDPLPLTSGLLHVPFSLPGMLPISLPLLYFVDLCMFLSF